MRKRMNIVLGEKIKYRNEKERAKKRENDEGGKVARKKKIVSLYSV